MDNIYIIPFVTTILFCLAKLIEMKFIDKELKPMKFLVRDAIIVFACSLLASYIFFNSNGSIDDFMSIITETKTIPKTTEIFTDVPGF